MPGESRPRDYRRIVDQLRAKARSTSFPAEAEALLARADNLERKHCPAPEPQLRPPSSWATVGTVQVTVQVIVFT